MTKYLDPAAMAVGSHIPDREIWMVAGLAIEKHGELAPVEAAKEADACLQAGDFRGQRFWQRVIRAITAMTDTHGDVAH